MPQFFNHNQILGVSLIPVDAMKWKVGDMLVPFAQVYHWQKIRDAKRLVIAYHDGQRYRSVLNDSIIPNNGQGVPLFDGYITTDPIPLMLDVEEINFKSSTENQRSGTLYTNKLEYTLQKMSAEEFTEVEQQLCQIQSGQAFHLLLSLYSCDAAKSIVLCPNVNAFSAQVENSVTDTQVSMSIKNLTSCQYLK